MVRTETIGPELHTEGSGDDRRRARPSPDVHAVTTIPVISLVIFIRDETVRTIKTPQATRQLFIPFNLRFW